MLGGIIIAIVIIVAIPVGVLVSGGVGAGIIGYFLRDTTDAANEGSELLDLNG